ncbi:MAG: hypothetical protein WC890_00050 [Candidatus Margulisiibacteriota bacterium]
MNKYIAGILCGIIAGVIDVTPMLLMKLPWTANLSAFLMWVVIGFLIVTSALKINGVLKGLLISFCVLLPSLVIIGAQNPIDLIPVIIMTLILGSLLGFFVEMIKE